MNQVNEKPLYGVKYCGGCNNHYDRKALLQKLKKDYGTIEFAQHGNHYHTIFVLCGCTSQCADISGLHADHFIWYHDFN